MKETRRQRLEQAIQEELSTVISREIKDPRVSAITLTRVSLVDDASHAVVYFLPLGALISPAIDSDIRDSSSAAGQDAFSTSNATVGDGEVIRKGLVSATGFLRKHLASRLHVRIVPTLDFQFDRGMENSIRVQEILKKI